MHLLFLKTHQQVRWDLVLAGLVQEQQSGRQEGSCAGPGRAGLDTWELAGCSGARMASAGILNSLTLPYLLLRVYHHPAGWPGLVHLEDEKHLGLDEQG